MIQILSRHSVLEADLRYLRWVKAKRDFFVHRFFTTHPWPGDMEIEDSDLIHHRLLYLS